MSKIKVIKGEIFKDHRGSISSLNAFDFEGVERFYFIKNSNTTIIRGWHGHQFEKKWFYCVKGSFTMAFVKIDNWESPSVDLIPEIHQISDGDSKIICVPEGYANSIKASEEGSILMVYSGTKMPVALEDSWRYDTSMWVDWSKY